MRTFELPARGGFMLHEASKDLSELFTPGKHCDDFSTPAELREKVTYYLDHESERRAIAQAGHERAVQMNYQWWAQSVLDVVQC